MIINVDKVFNKLLSNVARKPNRYLYDTFELDERLLGLIGPRGVGKTTMLLQYIKNKIKDKSKVLYFSADSILFMEKTLYEFIDEKFEIDGIDTFFIDEIHKYPNWNQELKNIYDSCPDINIVFSGSSSMSLVKGHYDLSRRGGLYRLQTLSFREYLNLSLKLELKSYSFDEIINNHIDISVELSEIPQIMGHFKDFLKIGAYPYFLEGDKFYKEKLFNSIEKMIYEDIPSLYNLKTEKLYLFKKIITTMSVIPPGELNINKLARNVGCDSKTTEHYVNILSETSLVRKIYSDSQGAALMRRPEKIFLNDSNIYSAITETIGINENLGIVREIFFVSSIENSGGSIFYSKEGGDYRCNNIVFEIGDPGKTKKQIKNIKGDAYLVKDNMSIGSKKEIPLYLFGFLY